MPMLPAKIRAARAGVGLSQQSLADESGVHQNTVRGIERNRPATYEALLQCQVALERHGVEFIEHGGRHGLIFPKVLSTPGAAALRASRAAMMMSRDEVAETAGLTVGTIGRIEAGRGSVHIAYIEAYVRIMLRVGVEIINMDNGVLLLLPPLEKLRLALEGRPGSRAEDASPER